MGTSASSRRSAATSRPGATWSRTSATAWRHAGRSRHRRRTWRRPSAISRTWRRPTGSTRHVSRCWGVPSEGKSPCWAATPPRIRPSVAWCRSTAPPRSTGGTGIPPAPGSWTPPRPSRCIWADRRRRTGEQYDAAEPERFVTDATPPTLFLQGLRDEHVSPFHAEFVSDRLIEAEVQAPRGATPMGHPRVRLRLQRAVRTDHDLRRRALPGVGAPRHRRPGVRPRHAPDADEESPSPEDAPTEERVPAG